MGAIASQPLSGLPEMTLRLRVRREMGGTAASEPSSTGEDGVARYSHRLAHSARSNSLLYGNAFFVMLICRMDARLLGVRSERKGTAASILVWKAKV